MMHVPSDICIYIYSKNIYICVWECIIGYISVYELE